MIDAELKLEASRRSPDGPPADLPDCHVHVVIRGPNFSSASAVLRVDGADLVSDSQANLHAFCARAIGTPAVEWPEVGNQIGVTVASLPSLRTTEQNLVKAGMLFVLWIEPSLVAGRARDLESALDDEIIIDHSTRATAQRLIYFPPRTLLERGGEAAVQRLYDLHLLCRLHVRIADKQIDVTFVPLVTNPVLVHRFDNTPDGGPTYRSWLAIKERMRERIVRAVGR